MDKTKEEKESRELNQFLLNIWHQIDEEYISFVRAKRESEYTALLKRIKFFIEKEEMIDIMDTYDAKCETDTYFESIYNEISNNMEMFEKAGCSSKVDDILSLIRELIESNSEE